MPAQAGIHARSTAALGRDRSRERLTCALGPRLRGDDGGARGEAVFDIKWIRDNPEAFDAGLRKRGLEPGGRREVLG